MKKVFAIFGYISTATIILIAGFFAYRLLFPLKAGSGDLIVFQTKFNGPEATTAAYVLRGESPNTQFVGELTIPSELKNGEIKGKFFDSYSSILYFTNENGFYIYDMKNSEVKTIQLGQGGFTFKNINGTIWYNLDVGFNQEHPENGYTNQLCEYSIIEDTNKCHTIHNMQIFDVAIDDENYYLVGYSSDYNNYNNMIKTFGVFNGNFTQREKFTIDFDGGWLPEVFLNYNNLDDVIINNEVVYYSYQSSTNELKESLFSSYSTFLSSGETSYYVSGGGNIDYDQKNNCTNIAFSGEDLNCKSGRLVIEPFYDSHRSNPNSDGLLIRPNTIILNDGIMEEYINVIDLNKLYEVKRFNLVEPISNVKDAIYIP